MKRKVAAITLSGLALALGGCASTETGSSPTTARATTTTATRTSYELPTTSSAIAQPPAAASTASNLGVPGVSDADVFLATLAMEGIDVMDDDLMINVGRSVCGDLDKGTSFIRVGAAMASAADGVYSTQEVGYIMGAAIPAFCPEHRDKIPN